MHVMQVRADTVQTASIKMHLVMGKGARFTTLEIEILISRAGAAQEPAIPIIPHITQTTYFSWNLEQLP